MSASQQEAFVATIAEASLGAPFLFEPDQYRTGSGLREPADLAWVCRRTVFLFNMTAGKKSPDHQIEHNMKQLLGWLRIWSSGRSLTGTNQWQSFSINVDDVDQIVLLAIVSSSREPAFAKFLWDKVRSKRNTAEKKLVAAVALPEAVLMDLAQRGGSALDLADYLAQLSTLPGVRAEGALQLLEEQNRSAVSRARAVAGSHTRPEEATNLAWRVIMAVRQMPAAAVHRRKVLPGLTVFNDLDWEDTTRLIVALADCTELVRNVPVGEIGPISSTLTVDAGNYFFIVEAADLAKVQESSQNGIRIFGKHQSREPILIMNLLTGRPVVQAYSPMIAATPPTNKSATSVVLESIDPANEGTELRRRD